RPRCGSACGLHPTPGRRSAWWRSRACRPHTLPPRCKCQWPWFTWPRARCRRCSRKKSRNSNWARDPRRGSQHSSFAPTPRSHRVPSCPSDETLTGLLADSLTPAERDSLARHVEGCAPCQEKLARLTGTPDTERWRRAEHPPQGPEAEEGMVRRLKRLPPSSAARCLEQVDRPAGDSPQAAGPTPVAVDSEPPAVPGFAILGELGRGGMGVVYQARQVALQRTVALKMVLNGAHADQKKLDRFRDEAELIARLQHPNIVQIYDVGEAAGRTYFVLEFVAGGS